MIGVGGDGIVSAAEALPGRAEAMRTPEAHYVLRPNRMTAPWPEGHEVAVIASGCFWGSEKGAWRIPGVYSTAVGYVGGHTKNPTYEEACSGRTGHTEGCVRVIYDPKIVSFADLLAMHWTSHDPTQGDGQGNDRGTQYRSGLYCSTDEQLKMARDSREAYQGALRAAGKNREITTEIKGPGDTFYFAEDYHQQYLAKPGSRKYCSAEPTGVPMPTAWLKANGGKFGPGFWAKYGPKPGCTIGVPDAQVSLDAALEAK
ncbi:peptide methionine sulfoxide reductase MsrA [Ostreococcus tauri]|uniref:peptide-methionine (S)-S-oxide reductase n=1 Tax=Ostreococcus tauri TaxID=70448 RepID=A0A1Y5I8E0_OSTTA|nr:peptide methionine sulfoxide reductase MsrA [Ostreococcus tauri]